MKRIKRTNQLLSAALLASTLAIGYQVYAHCGKCAEDGKKIATAFDKDKFTLAKAVTAAEEHSKGRSISAISTLSDKGQPLVHVYCMAGDKIVMCHVDPATGSVKGMKDVDEFPTPPKGQHADDHNHQPGQGIGGGAGGHGGGGAPPQGDDTALMIRDRNVEAGCGSCIYKMSDVKGCPLAVMIDGKAYLVQGAAWPNHDYCDAKQQAVVTGKIVGDPPVFIATKVAPQQ